jgi:hypothetical protein
MDENAGDIIQLHFMDSRLNPAGMTTSNQPQPHGFLLEPRKNDTQRAGRAECEVRKT